VILGVAFLVIAARLWYLQVLRGEEFEKFSLDNRIRIQRVPAPRGRILDRNGRELVVNRPSFDIYLLPEDLREAGRIHGSLSQILQISIEDIKGKVAQAVKKSRFKPVLIAQDINRDQLALIEARRTLFPGLIIEVNNLREYPYGKLGASFLGYIGKVTEADLNSNPNVYSNDLLGKTGIEKAWENSLRGEDGFTQNVTDALGRNVDSKLFLEDLHNKNSIPGDDILLAVDIDLQKAAEEALGEQFGAIVAVNVNSGEVLALASNPSYDPVDFIKGIDHDTWNELINDKSFPLVNRATQGLYAPGSVFKMVAAAAALKEGVVTADTVHHCPGYYKLGTHTFRCWNRAGHGPVNLHQALVQSCDVYFYKVAEKLGINSLSKYMKDFGFGSRSGIGIEEQSGVAPSREWKQKRFKKPWYQGETIVSAIGQGYVNVTPLQVVMMTAAVANGGVLLKPTLVKKAVTYSGETSIEYSVNIRTQIPVDSEMLAHIQDALVGVVNDPGGTGWRARFSDFLVAGKTGTAQVVSLDTKGEGVQYKDHAWFTSYAPADKPQIAVTVLIEHGGQGGVVAAPIAKQIIRAYIKLLKEKNADDNA